jgi:hypothetical protein
MKDWMKIGLGAIVVSRLMGSKSRYGNPQMRCPRATQDQGMPLNIANRQSTIDKYEYGPPNPARPSNWYWKNLAITVWKLSKKMFDNKQDEAEILGDIRSMRCANCVAFDVSPRMESCMPGPVSASTPKANKPIESLQYRVGSIDAVDLEWNDAGAGKLGYCWMHHFKCYSARSCSTWAAGGPITKDSVSNEWQKRAMKV